MTLRPRPHRLDSPGRSGYDLGGDQARPPVIGFPIVAHYEGSNPPPPPPEGPACGGRDPGAAGHSPRGASPERCVVCHDGQGRCRGGADLPPAVPAEIKAMPHTRPSLSPARTHHHPECPLPSPDCKLGLQGLQNHSGPRVAPRAADLPETPLPRASWWGGPAAPTPEPLPGNTYCGLGGWSWAGTQAGRSSRGSLANVSTAGRPCPSPECAAGVPFLRACPGPTLAWPRAPGPGERGVPEPTGPLCCS